MLLRSLARTGPARGLATVAATVAGSTYAPVPSPEARLPPSLPSNVAWGCAASRALTLVLFCAPRVKCTFILAKQKQKVTVPGMVGWTLLETAKHHNLPVNGSPADTPWDYNTFGEGPASVEDHVVVAQEYWELCLPMGYQEKDLLEMAERFQQPMCTVASGRSGGSGGLALSRTRT